MQILIFLLFVIVIPVLFIFTLKAKKEAEKARDIALKENNDLINSLKEAREKASKENSSLQSYVLELQKEIEAKQVQIEKLSAYERIIDIEEEIKEMRSEAEQDILQAKYEADTLREKGKAEYEAAMENARRQLALNTSESSRIIREAEDRAKEIVGDAYELSGKVKDLEKIASAMKNVIEGYGDQYLKPTYSLLDDLSDEFGYDEAGKRLKLAREYSAKLATTHLAAKCDYAETYRRDTAIAFVTDAFNGKVDSILSKIKKDNYGTLEQKIKDAYEIVNYNGRAFRNATIRPEYLSARLEELKWGVRVQELKAKAQEEQRRIREQIREEERARREYEKAMKEAAKEEEMLRRAMEKAQRQMESATAAKRAEYESKLEDLKQQLAEAEERGKRALSMAQQTKHGNVYVISNIGSFGEDIYKVGMTRRLDPLDRVRELGDASVPFPFDVHAIIESDDAPALESKLHKLLTLKQVNKVNPRKEFFKVTLSDIKTMVDNLGLKTSWTMEAAAAEYRETLAIEAAMESDPEKKRQWEQYNTNIEKEEIAIE